MLQYLEYLVYFSVFVLLYISINYNIFRKEIRSVIFVFSILHGLSVIILGSYLSSFFGLIILIAGIYGLNIVLANDFLPNSYDYLGISERIVNKYQPLGLIGILVIIFYNEFILSNNYGSNDYISFILCLLLIFYTKFNSINSNVTNLIFLSTFFLFMLLIIPRLIVIYFYDNLYLDFDRLIVFNFLNKPLQKILLLLGYSASSDLSTLRFYDLNNNLQAVDIARNCSGLQTVSLFISFFSSYVLVVKRKIGLEALVFILFGIILSYIANLFRMLIIVLVGIHYSIDQMLLIHHNIGWLIFTAWFFVFWQIYLFFSQESGDEL